MCACSQGVLRRLSQLPAGSLAPLAPLIASLPPALPSALAPQAARFSSLHGMLGGSGSPAGGGAAGGAAASGLPPKHSPGQRSVDGISSTSLGSSTADGSDGGDLLLAMEGGVDGVEPPWPVDKWVRAHAARLQRCV